MNYFGIVSGNLMILTAFAGLYPNGKHDAKENISLDSKITQIYFGFILLGLILLVTGYDWSL